MDPKSTSTGAFGISRPACFRCLPLCLISRLLSLDMAIHSAPNAEASCCTMSPSPTLRAFFSRRTSHSYHFLIIFDPSVLNTKMYFIKYLLRAHLNGCRSFSQDTTEEPRDPEETDIPRVAWTTERVHVALEDPGLTSGNLSLSRDFFLSRSGDSSRVWASKWTMPGRIEGRVGGMAFWIQFLRFNQKDAIHITIIATFSLFCHFFAEFRVP